MTTASLFRAAPFSFAASAGTNSAYLAFAPTNVAGSRGIHQRSSAEVKNMLKWALIFLIISVVAGLFGFTGISAAAGGVARILFFIAIVIFLIFVVLAMLGIGAVT